MWVWYIVGERLSWIHVLTTLVPHPMTLALACVSLFVARDHNFCSPWSVTRGMSNFVSEVVLFVFVCSIVYDLYTYDVNMIHDKLLVLHSIQTGTQSRNIWRSLLAFAVSLPSPAFFRLSQRYLDFGRSISLLRLWLLRPWAIRSSAHPSVTGFSVGAVQKESALWLLMI